jgi:hypothetical protein
MGPMQGTAIKRFQAGSTGQSVRRFYVASHGSGDRWQPCLKLLTINFIIVALKIIN